MLWIDVCRISLKLFDRLSIALMFCVIWLVKVRPEYLKSFIVLIFLIYLFSSHLNLNCYFFCYVYYILPCFVVYASIFTHPERYRIIGAKFIYCMNLALLYLKGDLKYFLLFLQEQLEIKMFVYQMCFRQILNTNTIMFFNLTQFTNKSKMYVKQSLRYSLFLLKLVLDYSTRIEYE